VYSPGQVLWFLIGSYTPAHRKNDCVGCTNIPNLYMVRGGCILTCQIFMRHAILNDGVVRVMMACGKSLVRNGQTREYINDLIVLCACSS
jgi:hypothetical protein